MLKPSKEELKATWTALADLIDSLPKDDKHRYQTAIRLLVHDLRQNIGIIYNAESLLRRGIPNTTENLELLDSIRTANQRSIAVVTDLAKPFDRDITAPLKPLE